MGKYLLVTKGYTEVIDAEPDNIFYSIDLKYPNDFISLTLMDNIS